MNFVSTILDTLQALPDPLIYTFIAVTASGAVYSTIHHVKHWRLRKPSPPKLSGSAARRIEDSLNAWSLGVLAKSSNYNVAFAAKKILIERALAEPHRSRLLAGLTSTNRQDRIASLVNLRYIFGFKQKTQYLNDSKARLQIVSFAANSSQYEPLLLCLFNSTSDPEATRLAIQTICLLVRLTRFKFHHHQGFREWVLNPDNLLYKTETVEGILLVNSDDPTADLCLTEARQLISYVGESNWPLPEDKLSSRVIRRFTRIWDTQNRDQQPGFLDPEERALSDLESEGLDDDNEYDYTYEYNEFNYSYEFDQRPRRNSQDANENEESSENESQEEGGERDWEAEEERQSIGLLDEPEFLTPEDINAYLQAAEEAGMRSQDRRRNARRMMQEGTNGIRDNDVP